MTIFDEIFPLGIGTSRLPVIEDRTEKGVEQSTQLILQALEHGMSYIDTASNYSASLAPAVLKRVLSSTKQPYQITTKVAFAPDRDADDTRRLVVDHLNSMGVFHADYFVAWSVMSYAEFEQIIRPGGIYDGAVRLQDEGIVDHICFSTHAAPPEIIRILQSGAFDGVTISYSLLNGVSMQSVLDVALTQRTGVVVMNPLGGGVIPENRAYFDFAREEPKETAIQGAIRYLMAHPAVKIVLSGATEVGELEENLAAVRQEEPERKAARLSRVNSQLKTLTGFCTGCRYCEGCPKGIPIQAFMQSHNSLLFQAPRAYNRTDPDLLKNIHLFRKLNIEYTTPLSNSENPCIRCGRCEDNCTQHLAIPDAIDEIYRRAKETGCDERSKEERLARLLKDKGYRRVGFYPGGRYTARVLSLYRQFFGEPTFSCFIFDSNPSLWGTDCGGFTIHGPDDILDCSPEAILVSNYHYSEEIYHSIVSYQKQGIKILRLHTQVDVPWFF